MSPVASEQFGLTPASRSSRILYTASASPTMQWHSSTPPRGSPAACAAAVCTSPSPLRIERESRSWAPQSDRLHSGARLRSVFTSPPNSTSPRTAPSSEGSSRRSAASFASADPSSAAAVSLSAVAARSSELGAGASGGLSPGAGDGASAVYFAPFTGGSDAIFYQRPGQFGQIFAKGRAW